MKCCFGLLVCATAVTAVVLLTALQADEPDTPNEPTKRVDPGSLPEVQDVIFFTEKRPILLRMRLYVDDKPGNERWEAFQKKLFAYLDTDGDGFLDKTEAERVISPGLLTQFFSGQSFFNGISPAPAFEDLDTNKDGKISPEELAAYYRRNNAGPYAAITGSGRGQAADQLTKALFTALDANKDGKLSKEELQVADKILLKFDDNDDEMLTPQELLATAVNPFGVLPPAPPRSGVPSNGPPVNILLVTKEDGKDRVVQRLKIAKDVLARYDTNKNNTLRREEIAFPKEVFDALDTNKDDKLDALELLRWVVATPDVEFTVRLGRVDNQTKLLEAANDGKGRGGLKLTPTSQTTLAMAVENSEVSVVYGGLPRINVGTRVQAFVQLERLFKLLDSEQKGFVTRKQLDDQQKFGFLAPLFPLLDADGDGKVTEKELQAFIAVMSASTGCQIAVTFSDNGQGLFELLDSNGDGQLSIREMRNAWNRLATHDHDGDGCISKAEIPRQYQLLIGASQNQGSRQGFVDASGRMVAERPRGAAPERGPLWFRKMDVNGDGDVSEREFLGSREDFRRINTSGDGLISVEEAEKADTWFRQKVQQK